MKKAILLLMLVLLISSVSAVTKYWITSTPVLKNVIWLDRYGTGSVNVVYIAGQHGQETKGIEMGKGFENSLNTNTAFNTKFMTYVFPVANPDGVQLKRQENYDWKNINRFWNVDSVKEIKYIRNRISNIKNITVFIDNHALNSHEKFSYISFHTLDKNVYNDKERICSLVKEYLPKLDCRMTLGCSTPDLALGYSCLRGIKYVALIETSQDNTTTAQANEMGRNLDNFIYELVK